MGIRPGVPPGHEVADIPSGDADEQIFQPGVRAESSRRPPRHRRGQHDRVIGCTDTLVDFAVRPARRRLLGPRLSKVAEAWVAEMRFNTTKDGHDQMPLQSALAVPRVLYDLPERTQCRRCTRRTGRDPCAYLLWHNHRKKREEHKSPRTTACGYHAPPHELVLRHHQHHSHTSSSSSPSSAR